MLCIKELRSRITDYGTKAEDIVITKRKEGLEQVISGRLDNMNNKVTEQLPRNSRSQYKQRTM